MHEIAQSVHGLEGTRLCERKHGIINAASKKKKKKYLDQVWKLQYKWFGQIGTKEPHMYLLRYFKVVQNIFAQSLSGTPSRSSPQH